MVVGVDGSRAFVKNRTGTENYSYQILKALAKIDSENVYRVYLRPTFNLDTIVQQLNAFPKNFQFITINWPRFWTQGGLALKTFQQDFDVLFVPAHTLPVIRKPGLKTVVTVHDLGSEFLPKTHQLKQKLYLSFMQRHQLKGATRLIAVSYATKEDLVKKIGIDPKRIEVIYEGFDPNLFKPVKNDTLINTLKQYNLVPKNYFLFVGTVQPRKNLVRLIRAYVEYLKVTARQGAKNRSGDQVPVPSLVLVGSRGWLADEIYELPRRLGIEKQIKFLGRVDDKNLPVLYSGAAALVFPSLYEGFGLPILETQACQTPVITANLSSMPEVAGKGALLVDPYSINEITDAMIKITDSKVRATLNKYGKENIKRFSWEKCAKETLKVLEGAYEQS